MSEPTRLVVFDSPIGWIGISHCDLVVQRVRIGHTSKPDVCALFRESRLGPSAPNHRERALIETFERYFQGEAVDFLSVKIANEGMTEFQKSVVAACRRIPFGDTISYGGLAAKVGRSGAARAVGTVMRKNAFPIVVPCHRVVAAGGLGGFTGPQGVSTKVTLQAVEKAGVAS
jgi:methylated-DNA-[protein]-cysteine S-methyltransferase